MRGGAREDPARAREKAPGSPAAGRSRCAGSSRAAVSPVAAERGKREGFPADRSLSGSGGWGVPGFPGVQGCRDSPQLGGPASRRVPTTPQMQGVSSGIPVVGSRPSWEWILQGFQFQDRCWEEAGTEGGDGDTHSGVGSPSPRVPPITPGLCPRLWGRDKTLWAGQWGQSLLPLPGCPRTMKLPRSSTTGWMSLRDRDRMLSSAGW